MEHTCYHCGEPVDEGAAFCPNCNAPQIRVATAVEAQAATPPLRPGTPEEIQPPAQPAGFGLPSRAEPVSDKLKWMDIMPTALLLGGVIALVIFVPYLILPIAAGFLAVVFYERSHPGVALAPRTGARVGAIAGLFAAIPFAVLLIVQTISMAKTGKLHEAMVQQAAQNREVLAMMEKFMTPAGLTVLIVMEVLFLCAFFVGLSTIGGMLGAKLMKKKS